jgi:CubicO group peptidase (beta-lactamase class C family)
MAGRAAETSGKDNEMPSVLDAAAAHIREQAADYLGTAKIPGYLAGVYHDGAQAVIAHGTANIVTGAPMREDTGFPLGSVTKLLTTTLILQQAERGAIDPDGRS